MNENENNELNLNENEPLLPVEPVNRPDPGDLLPPETPVGAEIVPLPEAVEAEMAEAEADAAGGAQPVPAYPNRRSTFQVLGVALVWYYIYTLIRSLVNNEVEPGQRGLLIGFLSAMTLINIFLTYQTIKAQWKAYKQKKDASDT